MRYDAVLFDVDGTLVHSSPGILETMRHTFRQMGVDPETLDLNRFLGPPLRKTFSETLGSEEKSEQAVQIYREYYDRVGQHKCSVYPGVVEMLETLKRSGVILGTATCKALPVALPILKEQGLYRYFDVLGGATLDASIDDKPSVIRWALGQPALAGRRVLMVGDRADDLNDGAANGLDAAGVLYGYGSREELAACKPVLLAETCGQLTRYILDT